MKLVIILHLDEGEKKPDMLKPEDVERFKEANPGLDFIADITLHSNKDVEINKNGIPTSFNDFGNFGKRLAMKIVFGVDMIYEPIFKMFEKVIDGGFKFSSSFDRSNEKSLEDYIKLLVDSELSAFSIN